MPKKRFYKFVNGFHLSSNVFLCFQNYHFFSFINANNHKAAKMTQIIPQFLPLATITNTPPVRRTKPREDKRDGNPLIWRNSFHSHFPFATLEPNETKSKSFFLPVGRGCWSFDLPRVKNNLIWWDLLAIRALMLSMWPV